MYFDGPDTMGNAAMYGSAFRDATISVSGDFVQDVPNWIAYAAGASLLGLGVSIADAGKSAAGIQALLNSKGWIVENVSDQSGWTGDYIFRIDAVVARNYSDAEILAQVQRDLSSLFVVNGASMLSQPYTVPTGTTPSIYNPPPANYQTPVGGATVPGTGGISTQSALDAFTGGLGITTPIAIMGGLVLLVLIMKR